MKTNYIKIGAVILIMLSIVCITNAQQTANELELVSSVSLDNKLTHDSRMYKVVDNVANRTCYVTNTNTARGAGTSMQCFDGIKI